MTGLRRFYGVLNNSLFYYRYYCKTGGVKIDKKPRSLLYIL